jgi:hypothetical protein
MNPRFGNLFDTASDVHNSFREGVKTGRRDFAAENGGGIDKKFS